jgi:hypothetical protein
MRKALIFPAILLVSSCASGPREVRIPIPTPCVKSEDLGKADAHKPAPIPPLTGNAESDIGTITGAALRWKAYALELRALLMGCSAS